MVQYNNGIITMKAVTFYITIFVMLISLATGAYGLSRAYTDSKIEVIDTRVDGLDKNIEQQFCDIKDTLSDIKIELRELRKH